LAKAAPRLPCFRGPPRLAGQMRQPSGLQGQRPDAPGHHGIQRQATPQAGRGLQLALFNAAAAFENLEKYFDLPAAGIPAKFFLGFVQEWTGMAVSSSQERAAAPGGGSPSLS
jgi:hypothetical protein